MAPQAPPNFLRAAALAEYKKPVVVMPSEEHHEEEDAEPQPEFREQQQTPQVQLHAHEKIKYVKVFFVSYHTRFFPHDSTICSAKWEHLTFHWSTEKHRMKV